MKKKGNARLTNRIGGYMKIKYIIPILIILLWQSSGIAYDSGRAKTNLAHELAQCAAYFMLVSKAPGLDKSTTEKLWDSGISLSVLSAQITSEKLALARVDLEMKTMQREMDSNWKNISIINNEYGYPCQDLTKNPDSRLEYWLNKKD